MQHIQKHYKRLEVILGDKLCSRIHSCDTLYSMDYHHDSCLRSGRNFAYWQVSIDYWKSMAALRVKVSDVP